MRTVVMIAILFAVYYFIDIPSSKQGMVVFTLSAGFMWAFIGDVLQYLHYMSR